jgi:uncharacterized membrane protein (UPF0127 family)
MKNSSVVSVKLLKNNAILADSCRVASSFWARFVGLMGRPSLNAGEGVWLSPCNNIHMWFMRFPIDVVFVTESTTSKDSNRRWTVTRVVANVKPWRVLPLADFRASDTLELCVGTAEKCAVQEGDDLCIN